MLIFVASKRKDEILKCISNHQPPLYFQLNEFSSPLPVTDIASGLTGSRDKSKAMMILQNNPEWSLLSSLGSDQSGRIRLSSFGLKRSSCLVFDITAWDWVDLAATLVLNECWEQRRLHKVESGVGRERKREGGRSLYRFYLEAQ